MAFLSWQLLRKLVPVLVEALLHILETHTPSNLTPESAARRANLLATLESYSVQFPEEE